ncbi:MAG: hypothetical protein KAZ38_13465, partial [Caldilineaceae bacterium]|nr:hypothetical protein [Caldilineaceae bacterium]
FFYGWGGQGSLATPANLLIVWVPLAAIWTVHQFFLVELWLDYKKQIERRERREPERILLFSVLQLLRTSAV